MADIGISYAHSEEEDAKELRNALVNAGLTVWMDTPSDEESVGIPVGQSHWDVIEREFASALIIVVLATSEWRERDYCQREYRRCRELGKPIRFIAPAEIAEKVAQVAEEVRRQRLALTAHARLARRVVEPLPEPRTWLQRIRYGRAAPDAVLVTSDENAPFEVTPEVLEVVEEDLSTVLRVRRQLRRVGVSVTAIVIVLAMIASFSWVLAQSWSRLAAENLDSARALELVTEAETEPDTLAAIALAAEANQLDPGDRTRTALAEAEMRDARLRVLDLPPADYLGAVWVSDSSLVLAYTPNAITVIDTATGEVALPIPVSHRIARSAVVADGETHAVYADVAGGVWRVSLTDGEISNISPTETVDLLAGGPAGSFVWATRKGEIVLGAMDAQRGALQGFSTYSLEERVRNIDVTEDALVLIDQNTIVHRFDLPTLSNASGTDDPQSSLRLVASSARIREMASSEGRWASNLVLCGDIVYGVMATVVFGDRFLWDTVTGEVTTERSGPTSPPVCAGHTVLSAPMTRGDVEEMFNGRTVPLPEGVWRVFSVLDPQHERTAFLSSQPGRLMIFDLSTAVSAREVEPLAGLVPLERATLQIGTDGSVRDFDNNGAGDSSGTLRGALGHAPTGLTIAHGCDALHAAQGALYHLSCDGKPHLVAEQDDLSAMQMGADGEHFVVARYESIDLISLDGAQVDRYTFDWISDLAISGAALSQDGRRLAFVTFHGEVYEFEIGSENQPEPFARISKGNGNTVHYVQSAATAPGPADAIIVAGNDGRALRFDAERELSASAQLPIRADQIQTDGELLVIGSFDGDGSILLDSITLRVIERFPLAFVSPRASADAPWIGMVPYNEVREYPQVIPD